MEYTIQQLADLAGVTTRTLRWYDKTGLLPPGRIGENGYRFYGPEQVDRLQHILLYKTLGMELEQIRRILDDPTFDRLEALRGHLLELQARERKINELIISVKELILTEERGETMSDTEKFKVLKQEFLRGNEEKYGQEARAKYGGPAAEASAAAIWGLSSQEYEAWMHLDRSILEQLEQAVSAGNSPEGEAGRQIAQLHRAWIKVPLGHTYDGAKHRGIVRMYVADERFRTYYDRNTAGCAQFLCDAVMHWIKE